LRKVGRNDEADQLQAEANKLLVQGSAAPSMPPDEARQDATSRGGTSGDQRLRDESRARSDVERAIDGLRREVEQLRREVRDLRQSLQRAPGGDESSRQEGRGRHPTDGRRAAPEFVNVEVRLRGEVVRLGEKEQPIRVGEHVKKGETLAVLWNKGLADMTGYPGHLLPRIAGEFSLVAPANGTIVE